jgi:serine/threonine-protein kinase RsbW
LTRIRYHEYDFNTLESADIQGAGQVNKSDFEISFGSELQYLDIVQSISDTITTMLGFNEDSRYWIGMSVRESVINAIVHGNKKDASKRVAVRFEISTGCLVIVVKDQGQGFDASELPDPLDPGNLLKPSGRGIFYIRTFMDDVRYTTLPGGGLEVRMEKRLNHKNQAES